MANMNPANQKSRQADHAKAETQTWISCPLCDARYIAEQNPKCPSCGGTKKKAATE